MHHEKGKGDQYQNGDNAGENAIAYIPQHMTASLSKRMGMLPL
jgi:hypothetical protein